MDLSFMHDAGTVVVLSKSAIIALFMGALGIAEVFTLGWVLFVIIASKSYNTSQGFIGHGGQLHCLALLAWWLCSVWTLALQLRRPAQAGFWKTVAWSGPAQRSLQIWCILQTIVATYFVSAVTKLINSEGTWAFRGGNFVLQILKAQAESVSAGGAEPGPVARTAVNFLSERPWVATVMLTFAVLLEFFAFLALRNRRLCLLIGLVLIGFHQSTEVLMSIGFGTHQQLLCLFLVNPVFWAVLACHWLVKCTTAPEGQKYNSTGG